MTAAPSITNRHHPRNSVFNGFSEADWGQLVTHCKLADAPQTFRHEIEFILWMESNDRARAAAEQTHWHLDLDSVITEEAAKDAQRLGWSPDQGTLPPVEWIEKYCVTWERHGELRNEHEKLIASMAALLTNFRHYLHPDHASDPKKAWDEIEALRLKFKGVRDHSLKEIERISAAEQARRDFVGSGPGRRRQYELYSLVHNLIAAWARTGRSIAAGNSERAGPLVRFLQQTVEVVLAERPSIPTARGWIGLYKKLKSQKATWEIHPSFFSRKGANK